MNAERCIIGAYDLDANGVMAPKVVESVLGRICPEGRISTPDRAFGGIDFSKTARTCLLVEVPDRITHEAAHVPHLRPN